MFAHRQVLLGSSAAIALFTGASLTQAWAQTAPATPAPASTPAPAAAEEAQAADEKVVVTGSRIKRDEFNSAGPVIVINPAAAERKGEIDLGSTIQSSSIAAGSSQITSAISSNFVTNGGPGAQTVSLRGLGAERTLVLLNGRRAAGAGVRGAVGAFDLNVIPQSMVQNVEVLKDGASSVYGSDAVAGVVNIITKKGTDGIELSAFASRPIENGGEEVRTSLTFGEKFDNGHIQVGFDYYKRDPLKRGDRKYLNCPEEYIFDTDGNRNDVIDPRTGKPMCNEINWGHVWVYDYNGAPNSNFVARRLQFNYPGQNLAAHIPEQPGSGGDFNLLQAPPGWFPVGYDLPSHSVDNLFHPFMSNADVIPRVERATVFVDGALEISEGTELYGELLLNRRKTKAEGYRQFWNYMYTATPGAPNWTGDSWMLSPLSITDHTTGSQLVDYARFVAGARGSLPDFFEGFFNDVQWDIYAQHSRSDGDYSNDRILQDAMDAHRFQFVSCVGDILPVSGRPCIDIDWTDPEFLRGNFTPQQRAFLFDSETGNTIYKQTTAEGVLSGDLFDIWAGTVNFALGATYRIDEIRDVPGPITLANNAWGSSGGGITEGESKTTEVYGELEVPVFKDSFLGDSFTLQLAGRHTKVSTVSGGGDQTYRVGANWKVNDWLRFRGGYGTSFRAPGLFELFLADETSFLGQNQVDPCRNWGLDLANGVISQQIADNCALDGVPPGGGLGTASVTVVEGGGLGVLKPETSVAKSLSVIFNGNSFLPEDWRTSLAIDYFEIEVSGEIDTLSAGAIVRGCYDSPIPFPGNTFCTLFDRNNDVGVGVNPHAINNVRASFVNINSQVNRGIDVTYRLAHDLADDYGTLTLLAQMTWQLEDQVELFAGEIENFEGQSGEPKWVGDFSLNWDGPEGWSALYGLDVVGSTSNAADFMESNNVTTMCQFSSLRNRTRCLDYDAEATFFHSFSVSKEFDAINVTLGMANLTDEVAPRVSTIGSPGISTIGQVPFTSNYDFVGRRGFLSVSYKYDN